MQISFVRKGNRTSETIYLFFSILMTALHLTSCASAPTPGPVPTPGGELSAGTLATFKIDGETFRVWVTNLEGREQLDLAASGQSTATIPAGPILEGPGPGNHNAPWGWHFDPIRFSLIEAGQTSCDALPSHVNENRSHFINDIGQYCPRNADLLDITSYP
jgi:hypothetical protein